MKIVWIWNSWEYNSDSKPNFDYKSLEEALTAESKSGAMIKE